MEGQTKFMFVVASVFSLSVVGTTINLILSFPFSNLGVRISLIANVLTALLFSVGAWFISIKAYHSEKQIENFDVKNVIKFVEEGKNGKKIDSVPGRVRRTSDKRGN